VWLGRRGKPLAVALVWNAEHGASITLAAGHVLAQVLIDALAERSKELLRGSHVAPSKQSHGADISVTRATEVTLWRGSAAMAATVLSGVLTSIASEPSSTVQQVERWTLRCRLALVLVGEPSDVDYATSQPESASGLDETGSCGSPVTQQPWRRQGSPLATDDGPDEPMVCGSGTALVDPNDPRDPNDPAHLAKVWPQHVQERCGGRCVLFGGLFD
jgi:hypothetical protein